jgi:ATP-dependent Clp protease protease subunit
MRNYTPGYPQPIMSKSPVVFEEGPRGERAYDIFSRLVKERIIWLGGPIVPDVADMIVAQLVFLDRTDSSKPIDLYINSPGGHVTAGLAIYDAMQFVRCPVYTLCVGEAASMGAVLLLSGHRGERAALPNSRIMLHQPSGGYWGTQTDVEIQAEELRRLKGILNGIISEHTGRDLDAVHRALERDMFMSAKEAKDWGVIDKIMGGGGKRRAPKEE